MNHQLSSLIKDFESCIESTGNVLSELPFEQVSVYADWLFQTYSLVKNTTRLVCLAAGNTQTKDRQLHYDWIDHLKGELNHDLIALHDLKVLGVSMDEIPERMETQLIRQNQFYWLDRGAASSLSGYALLLEGLAALHGKTLLARIEKSHGPKAATFLRLHCEVDEGHYADGLKTLEKISENELDGVRQNLMQSTHLYKGMAISIARETRKVGLRQAA